MSSDLDTILIQAWNRISRKVRQDRLEALKRFRRRSGSVLSRPMREWCLVIRASDTRINSKNTEIEPFDAIQNHEPHTVEISGYLVRHLTKPIMIPWPGVTYEEAAKTLGRTYQSLHHWVRAGVFQFKRYPRHGFPEDGRKMGRKRKRVGDNEQYQQQFDRRGSVSAAWAKRSSGGGKPHVWTESPLDPNNWRGRSPHPMWGTIWQWMWEDFPRQFVMHVQREPEFRVQPTRQGKRAKFVGWDFICPGRLDHNLQFTGCGARCNYLYLPQTVWTLPKAMDIGKGAGFDLPPPDESGLTGAWYPGLSDSIAAGQPRSFACKKCWGVRSACMANYTGWNEFVTHISGGLLYGKEVPRPLDVCPIVRQKRLYKKRTRKDAANASPAIAATS